MNKMKIYLSPDQYTSLLFITNGENIVRAKDMVDLYPEFLGPELTDIVRECNLIEFYTC